jgi:hypothetical protein
MTVPAYVKFNSRERALSTDQNRQAILSRRALAEAIAALSTGTLKQSGVFGASFLVAPQAGTMKCSITPGIGLIYDNTAVFPYSTMSWIESSVLREVTLDAGDGNPRYDVIEMRAGSATTLTQPRDEFNPLTGSFSVVNMAKEVASYPEFQVRKGTPAVLPSIPTGTAGWIPLAYVAVPGGAVTLLADNVVHCRPILDAQPGRGWTDPTLARYGTAIRGGGITVSSGGAISTSNVTVGRFPGHHHDFRIEAGAEAGFGSLVWDGGGAPAVSGPMYFYAVPAPYPAGYDASMAPREFWTPDATVVYGSGSGFADADLQEGCIIISSTTAPVLTHESGHPAAGNGTINHSFFSPDPSIINRSTWVYLGAASYDHGFGVVTQQDTTGATVSTKRKPGYDFLGDMPIGADKLFSLWSELTASVIRWPVTALSVECQLATNINAGGNLAWIATDEHSGTTSPQGWHAIDIQNDGAGSIAQSVIMPMRLNSSGQATIKAAAHVGATVLRLWGRTYRDEVLALRMG